MRFDEYLRHIGIVAIPVDSFDGFEVDVEGPAGWEAVESQPGMRIWIWPEDPYRQQFCGNAVLTMHRVPVSLDPADVFEMLCDEQVQLVGGGHERYRAGQLAEDGIGIRGMLSVQFDSEFGAIGSASQTRIITAAQETLIAQLTVTALLGSPANVANVRLTVVSADAAPDRNRPATARPIVGGLPAPRAADPTTVPGGDQ